MHPQRVYVDAKENRRQKKTKSSGRERMFSARVLFYFIDTNNHERNTIMDTNTQTTDTIVTYTTAEEAYDGFGTKTVAVVGKDNRGRDVRKVETPARHVDWQRMRYGSGLHMAQDESEFAKCVEYGFVTLTEEKSEPEKGDVKGEPERPTEHNPVHVRGVGLCCLDGVDIVKTNGIRVGQIGTQVMPYDSLGAGEAAALRETFAPYVFKVGDGVHWNAGTDMTCGTIVKVTKSTIYVVEDEAKLLNSAGSDEPDALKFHPGGFAGHTEGHQRWAFSPGRGEPIKFTLRKKTGFFKESGTSIDGSMRSWGNLRPGRRKHYDFNF